MQQRSGRVDRTARRADWHMALTAGVDRAVDIVSDIRTTRAWLSGGWTAPSRRRVRQWSGTTRRPGFEQQGIPALFFGDGESADYHQPGDTTPTAARSASRGCGPARSSTPGCTPTRSAIAAPRGSRSGPSSEDLEQAGGAHAAADAHRDDAVLGAAPLALEQDVAGHPGAGHPIRVADRDRAARDIQLVVGDAELVATVDRLARERLVELPEVDLVHLDPGLLEQLGDREHRTDAHLLGAAAGDRHAAIGAQRREPAALGFLRLHQDHRGGAV